MKFAIITHVVHTKNDNKYFGYSPYVREMNIWLKYVDELVIVAPLSSKKEITEIDDFYSFENVDFKKIPDFNFTNFSNIFISLFKMPIIFWKIFWVMKQSDHIHLRCPGNVGLIGCLVQVLFPNKIKTAKYAGNWDPKSKQPWSYRFQKWILSNAFLTRNMKVLVYGEWPNQSKNIKSFFTATYSESEKSSVEKANFKNGIKFVFVGNLVVGKNPLYAVKLVELLLKNGNDVTLDLYGEGVERNSLENYIQMNKLDTKIFLRGNHSKETLIKAYQKSHFVILPSKSEGWPKAIAEGMFWGCVPIATKVSCVPFMLGYGERGILLKKELKLDIYQLEDIINCMENFNLKRERASEWSRKYTLNIFEDQIEKMLK